MKLRIAHNGNVWLTLQWSERIVGTLKRAGTKWAYVGEVRGFTSPGTHTFDTKAEARAWLRQMFL